jgi:hypothetical protein
MEEMGINRHLPSKRYCARWVCRCRTGASGRRSGTDVYQQVRGKERTNKHHLTGLFPGIKTLAFYLYNVRIISAFASYHDSILQKKWDERLFDFVSQSRFDHNAQAA